ncbi:MAG: HAD family phosphatase [Oscillospiraceae bacterium]|nr:HAD family phosphatase [Oscillospiraceae bacterium]
MKDFSVIFDMDGVIIINSEFHVKAWDVFCKKYDIILSDYDIKNYILGTTNKTALDHIFKGTLSEDEVLKFSDEKELTYRTLYKPYLKENKGVIDFLKLLKQNHIKIALATSAQPSNLDFIVDNLKIRGYFDFIIHAMQVNEGKPNPEIYLKAAKGIHEDPNKCIVIEDSIPGIKSALSANMKVIAITTTHKKDELKDASLIIDSFSELNMEVLESLINKG